MSDQERTKGEKPRVPCDCPAFHVEYNDHTEAEHTECRGSIHTGDLCGGCDSCLSMRAFHYARASQDTTP
jgi:hypothetical protein